MGYRHSQEEMLAAAVEVALAGGISSVTFGAVAKHAGVSDRMVVYYFPTKAELVTAVTIALGQQLQELLGGAFGDEPLDRQDLLARAWAALARPRADPIFAVYFEILGLAAAGHQPFKALASAQTEAWVQWLLPRLTDADRATKRRQALATLAVIDGLLLLRQIHGPAAANAAARELGLA